MRLIYFVHNLNDPAVARRLSMLKAGGIETVVTGFWRGSTPPAAIQGAKAVSLGRSYDARLLHRALLALRHGFFPSRLPDEVTTADIFMARNLEMLTVAVLASRHAPRPPAIVYEALDIHRLLLGRTLAGQTLRAVERALMRKVSLLLVSSPAFLREYFHHFQFAKYRPEAALIENKALELVSKSEGEEEALPPGPPWRIGWLGMLRCRRSLQILGDLAARRPDLLDVRIFGRPTGELAQDLKKPTPGLEYGGPYEASDLPRLYRQMHFNWAIDYYEENANSLWLLPNRIYEGGRHNVIPLALRGTETARWLGELRLGFSFDSPDRELEPFLDRLTGNAYRQMKQAAIAAPRPRFVARQGDCDRLAHLLAQTAARAPSGKLSHVQYGLR